MSVPLFMIVSAYLLAPMKKGQSCWEFYRKRFLRIMPPFIFFFHGAVQHVAHVVGTDRAANSL